jgi:hypothetical protein
LKTRAEGKSDSVNEGSKIVMLMLMKRMRLDLLDGRGWRGTGRVRRSFVDEVFYPDMAIARCIFGGEIVILHVLYIREKSSLR